MNWTPRGLLPSFFCPQKLESGKATRKCYRFEQQNSVHPFNFDPNKVVIVVYLSTIQAHDKDPFPSGGKRIIFPVYAFQDDEINVKMNNFK